MMKNNRKYRMYQKRIVYAVCLMMLVVSIMSCSHGKSLWSKYERPDSLLHATATSSALRDAAGIEGADSVGFGGVKWQEVFTDPQLCTLIDKGLEQNVDIFEASANVQKMEAALKAARLAFLPQVTFTPSGTLAKVVSGDKKGDWNKSYAMPISASWTIDIFGSILATKRGAEVQLEMMKDYQHVTRSMVICGIANCYYTLLMLDRQLEILNDMEALTAETYRMMKLQKDLRGAKETAVISAQAANLSVKTDIIDMKRQIRETENTLSTLVGMHAQSISRGKLADQNLPENFSTGIALNVLSARPDVHAAEMKLANCFYDVKKAQSAFYPSLKITGTGSFTNSMGNAVSNPGFFLANFVAGLTQPIFMNGRLIAQLKVAKLSYEVAEKEWRQIILEAGAEVSNCLVEYNSSKEMEELERRQVEALAKSVDYTLMLYKMGTSSYLEVISAQSSLLNAEISQVVDEFNKMQAVVNLYSALGGGRE
jgi:NodT family efflux transporter outer membrane factor (OMF) lipoprotein